MYLYTFHTFPKSSMFCILYVSVWLPSRLSENEAIFHFCFWLVGDCKLKQLLTIKFALLEHLKQRVFSYRSVVGSRATVSAWHYNQWAIYGSHAKGISVQCVCYTMCVSACFILSTPDPVLASLLSWQAAHTWCQVHTCTTHCSTPSAQYGYTKCKPLLHGSHFCCSPSPTILLLH